MGRTGRQAGRQADTDRQATKTLHFHRTPSTPPSTRLPYHHPTSPSSSCSPDWAPAPSRRQCQRQWVFRARRRRIRTGRSTPDEGGKKKKGRRPWAGRSPSEGGPPLVCILFGFIASLPALAKYQRKGLDSCTELQQRLLLLVVPMYCSSGCESKAQAAMLGRARWQHWHSAAPFSRTACATQTDVAQPRLTSSYAWLEY